jgi:hypothetical protein
MQTGRFGAPFFAIHFRQVCTGFALCAIQARAIRDSVARMIRNEQQGQTLRRTAALLRSLLLLAP